MSFDGEQLRRAIESRARRSVDHGSVPDTGPRVHGAGEPGDSAVRGNARFLDQTGWEFWWSAVWNVSTWGG